MYIGGGYAGFGIFKYSLIIETLPLSPNDESNEEDAKASHAISHYFGTFPFKLFLFHFIISDTNQKKKKKRTKRFQTQEIKITENTFDKNNERRSSFKGKRKEELTHVLGFNVTLISTTKVVFFK